MCQMYEGERESVVRAEEQSRRRKPASSGNSELLSCITEDERRIVQKNIDEYLACGCVMSRASLNIIQKMLDAT